MMGDRSEYTMGLPPEEPAAIAKALALINELSELPKKFDVAAFEDEIDSALWWGEDAGSPGEENQLKQRANAQHWAMRELAAFSPVHPLAEYQLQIILTTLSVSFRSDRAVMDQLPHEMARAPLVDSLVKLMERATMDVGRRGADERHWREVAVSAGRNGNYQSLGNLIRHLEVRSTADIRLATILLKELNPARLADCIAAKKDVFFSVAVRDALYEDAAEFALSVTDITFKFVCVSLLADKRVEDARGGEVEAVRALVLQVAQTDLWRNWISEFAHYPNGDTVGESALSAALSQMKANRWQDFIDAIELWNLPSTALAVTKILLPFFQALKEEASAPMWQLAFERWDRWDYGSTEPDKYLLSPESCSLDFPVLIHYATIPLHETEAEEARLREFISTIEQRWFVDLLSLASSRNRAVSRLRLVQHGLTIRSHGTEVVNALPPPIEPKNEFERVRYRYFDPHTVNRRRR